MEELQLVIPSILQRPCSMGDCVPHGRENTRKHLQIIGVPLKFIKKELPKDDYRLAELYSDISILLEKLNENENAALFLEKAIQIMEKQPGTRVEVATSRTSLALIELKMDKLEAAEKHLELAISAFKEDGGKTDTHYKRSACRTRRGSATVRAVWERPWKIMSTRCLRWKSISAEKKATVCSAATARRSAESLDRAQKLKSMRCAAKILPEA